MAIGVRSLPSVCVWPTTLTRAPGASRGGPGSGIGGGWSPVRPVASGSVTAPILPGAEPWSAAGGSHGVLVLHGFTGNPQSMRPLAEACAAAGFTVELPLLPGHGTAVEDMVPTRWEDWSARRRGASSGHWPPAATRWWSPACPWAAR